MSHLNEVKRLFNVLGVAYTEFRDVPVLAHQTFESADGSIGQEYGSRPNEFAKRLIKTRSQPAIAF
jgi:hypothetical protein